MNTTLWYNANIATEQGMIVNGCLLVDDDAGSIVDIGKTGPRGLTAGRAGRTVDLGGKLVLPGLIDVHVHGGGGFETMRGTHEELDGMSRFHAEHGTTSFLATLHTDAPDRLERVLGAIRESAELGVSGAELLGAHLEGPFLNVRRAGAQDKSHIIDPDEALIDRWLRAADGSMRLVTLAPELPGGLAAVRRFADAGVTVSAGHTDATFAEMEAAVRAGVTHMTHHFNGMRPLHHREPGAAGAGLMLPELTIELIADGVHTHPEVIRMAFRAKPTSRVCMITDAVLCAGLPDGDYGHCVMERGHIYTKDRSSLAGSSLTMIAALRNALKFTDLSLVNLLPAFTSVPARQAGVGHRKGSLEAGKDADFIVVDEQCELLLTAVRGRVVANKGVAAV